MQSFVPADGDVAAREYIEDLHVYRFADFEAHIEASLSSIAVLDAKLQQVADYLPTSDPKKV